MPNKKVSRLAVLFGVGLGVVAATASAAPSFDCSKASTKVEKMICDDSQLADADAKLSDAYSAALKAATDKVEVKHKQIAWVKQRNACSDVVCVQQAYDQRLEELGQLATIADSQAATTEAKTAEMQTNVAQPDIAQEDQSVNAGTAPTSALVVAKQAASEAVTKATEPTASATIGKPSAGFVSNIASIVYFVLAILLIVGLLKPSWILRWDSKPTRLKIFAYFLAIGVPIGLVGEFAKSNELKVYEEHVRKQEIREQEAKAEKERENNQLAESNGVHSANALQMQKEICFQGSGFAFTYMTNRNNTAPLYESMEEKLNEYPEKMRPPIKEIWMGMLRTVDKTQDPRVNGSTDQQLQASADISAVCVRMVKNANNAR